MRTLRLGAVFSVIFLLALGWAANSIYTDISLNYYQQRELDAFYGNESSAAGKATNLQIADAKPGILQSILREPQAKASPSDRISESQIYVTNDKVIIAVKNSEWASFTPTHSMEPVLNEHSNAIEVSPKSESEINVGDIVSYNSEYSDGTIIHRVARIGYDDKGWYCIAKGDNNPSEDPGKIRFSQIERVVVAIIY
jgi:hypothetical protein